MVRQTLGEYLECYAETSPSAFAVASAVDVIATACIEIGELACDASSAEQGEAVLWKNSDSDLLKDLDLAWYDNEWGFSSRMSDTAAFMGTVS